MVDMAAVAVSVICWCLVSMLTTTAICKVIGSAKRNNGENDRSGQNDN